jgi:carboxyl-terminal processing protease
MLAWMTRKRSDMKATKLLILLQLTAELWAVPAFAAPPKRADGPAPQAAQVPASAPLQDQTLVDRSRTNHVQLSPGLDDWKIARVVAAVLRQSHYSQLPFDEAMSSKFLDRYLDVLDPLHLLFLQSDLDEFDRWRNALNDLTLKLGDTSPATTIFNRFLDRYEQEMIFATNLLAAEKFSFDGKDRYLANRRDQPRPRNLNEAHQLWRDRLRYEYLLETLNMARAQEVANAVLERLKTHSVDEIQTSIRASKEKKEQLKKRQAQAAPAAAETNETAAAKQDVRIFNEITSALKGKVGDEKGDQIADLVAAKLGHDTPEAIAQAVAAKIDKENAEEISKIISRRFARQWRMLREFDSDEVLQLYLTALAHAYDPHSDYMSKSTLDNFNISMKLSLFGIGALLQAEDGYVKIKELMPGPAMKSKKLKPNDRIVAVAQATNEPVDVVEMKLNKVVDLIRGPKGTEVRLTVIPADAPDPSMRKVVALIRDEIKLEDQEAKAKIIELPGEGGKPLRLGVIDLPSFYADLDSRKATRKSTTTDVGRLLTKLKQENVKGVVLDLRRNGGGSLEEAINLTGLFIKEGPVVQVRDYDGRVTVDSDTDPDVVYEGPLVVLTSRFSASASEILAAALQDYGRAVVVGDSSTHGKGTVQQLLSLNHLVRPPTTNNLGALKYTIRKFYRVNGSSTQLKGVIPDVVLPSVNNYADVGEASLTNALPWDTITKADFEPVNAVPSFLDELRRRSQQRVDHDADFNFLRGEIDRYRKIKDDRSVSLNEEDRFREKRDNEARAEARKKELRNRPEPNYKTYDITLKWVNQPGLPAPTVRTNILAAKEIKVKSLSDDELLEDEERDDGTPAPDITLDETERILLDLVGLTDKSKGLAGAVK